MGQGLEQVGSQAGAQILGPPALPDASAECERVIYIYNVGIRGTPTLVLAY